MLVELRMRTAPLTILLTLGLLLAANGAAADELPAWVATLTDGGQVRVAVPAPADPHFAHLSWCKAVRATDGTIVVAYIAGIFHGSHGGGSPGVSLSTDGGKTFSAPNILRVFDKDKDYSCSGNLALGVADDGAILLLAMAYTGDERNHIFGWRSTDHGRTWSETDTHTLGPNKTGSVFGNILSVPGRGLTVLGHYRAGSSPHTKGIWIASSADHGRTWSEPTRIVDEAVVEPMLVRSGERLIALLRKSGKSDLQLVSVSDDRGVSWQTAPSELKLEKPGFSLAAPCAAVHPDKPNELVVLTTERGKPGRIWLWRAQADKLDWRRERLLLEYLRIDGSKHTDYGYPWLVHVAGDRWLMFYYHGLGRGPNSIWVAELSLSTTCAAPNARSRTRESFISVHYSIRPRFRYVEGVTPISRRKTSYMRMGSPKPTSRAMSERRFSLCTNSRLARSIRTRRISATIGRPRNLRKRICNVRVSAWTAWDTLF